jgi:hypothetical protein
MHEVLEPSGHHVSDQGFGVIVKIILVTVYRGTSTPPVLPCESKTPSRSWVPSHTIVFRFLGRNLRCTDNHSPIGWVTVHDRLLSFVPMKLVMGAPSTAYAIM